MPTLTFPNTFTANTLIKSADLNANFTAVSTLLNSTKLDSTNVQANGLTRDRLATGTAHAVCTQDSSGNIGNGVAPGSSGNLLTSNGTDWVSQTPASKTSPTVQKFTSTGTTTGYVFTISTSTTCAANDTYTNNGNTYTVLAALSAQTGQVLFCSGAGGPLSSGTLTRASGSGTASITYTANTPLATYTAPTSPAPLYITVEQVGGGGGGAAGGSTPTTGGDGTGTFFGSNLLTALGGSGGNVIGGGVASKGQATIGTGATGTAVPGALGTGGTALVLANGISGASSPFGGAGPGGYGTGSAGSMGGNAIANSGSGGGGAGSGNATGASGGGGSAGGYIYAVVSPVSATYPYAIGGGGAGGLINGGNGSAGGVGGSGYIVVTEYYQ